MIQRVLPVGLIGCNCIILGDDASKEAAVVDPGGDAPKILMELSRLGLRVKLILHTHGHIDHMGGTGELARVTGAPTYLHQADQALFDAASQQAAMFGLPDPEPAGIDHALTDGQTLQVGSLSFEVLWTPGHSHGSVSFWLAEQKLCLSGDTLFAQGIGRTDLFGGSYPTLERSIRERLYVLGDDVKVLPGHGPATTIQIEKASNPFVRA